MAASVLVQHLDGGIAVVCHIKQRLVNLSIRPHCFRLGQRITASDLRYPRNAPYGCPGSIDELSVAQTATVCVDLRHGIVVARYLYLGVIVGGLRSHIEPFSIRERETGQRIT